MDPTSRFWLESALLVVGFGLVAVVIAVFDDSSGDVLPLVLLFALACWVLTILVPWLRTRRAQRRGRARER